MRKFKKKPFIIISSITVVIVIFLSLLFYNGKNVTINKISSTIKDFFAGSSSSGNNFSVAPRVEYNFNYGWTFSKGQGYNNAGTTYTSSYPKTAVTVIENPNATNIQTITPPYSVSYDESSSGVNWKDVSLPHTYNDEDSFNNFMETGLTGERTVYSGTAWYRKVFNLPSEYSVGKKIIIEFEAARQAAVVWVNGHKLDGTYENGFVAFGYEIPTEYLHFGEGAANENLIVVMTDNSYPYYMVGDETQDYYIPSTTNRVSWHDPHWHPNYGGLYRNTYLYVVDDVHLTLPLYSFTEGSGTYVYTTNETSNSVIVNISPEVKNSGITAKTISYRAIIKDALGNIVSLKNIEGNDINEIVGTNVTLNPGQTLTLSTIRATILNPKRWSTTYPYLYTCEVEILDEENNVIDKNSNTFGVRTFRFTSDYGFYLNEYYTEISGWGQKSTWEWASVGAAYPDWMTDYGIKMLKNAGGNYIRWGHVAGSPSQIKLADKYGILVTQPGVDGEGESSSSISNAYNSTSYQLRTEAFRDTIIYFRNNPSIIMWELGNQSDGLEKTANNDFINNISWLNYDAEKYANEIFPNSYASVLYEVIQKYDYGNRVGTINSAGTYENTNSSSNRLITIRHGDEVVKNLVDVAETTEGTGGMKTDALGNKPSIEGEYNRLEARRGVWDTSTEGFTSFTNISTANASYVNSTSETFAKTQMSYKANILNVTGNVGGANWIFSDSISHGRINSEAARASGEIDGVMLPKESYFVSQVINSKVPAIHIIGHWNYPASTTKNIFVAASNVVNVELFVNGVSKGFGAKSNNNQYSFANIAFETGTIEAKGYNSSGEEVISDSITSHGVPASINITPINGPGGLYANGSDILILDVELLDANGNRCISYDGEVNNSLIDFTYNLVDNGKIIAEWLGGYNSGVPENTRGDHLYFEAGIQRVFLRTTKNSGTISVTATMGSFSDSYTTLSLSIDNTNLIKGLSTFINQTDIVTLDDENNKGLGTGSILGLIVAESTVVSKLYIENLAYSGSEHVGNGVNDALGVGNLIYSDSGVTITDIPYKFSNAEMLVLPNDDRGIVADDLIAFQVTKNSNIYVARDPNIVGKPAWLLENYTLTTDTISASNGITYEIWVREINISIDPITGEFINQTITIGGNSDNGTSGILGYNQFIFVKETEKVENHVFFNENFNYFTDSNIINGYNAVIPPNTNILRVEKAGRTGLNFLDDTPNIVYIKKDFSELTYEFLFEFKMYIPTTKNNSWIRVFLSDGLPSNENDKSRLAVESYLWRDGNKVIFKYREGDTTYELINDPSIQTNKWNTYKYYVNPESRTWYVVVCESDTGNVLYTSEVVNFTYRSYIKNGQTISLNQVDSFEIGTGVNEKWTTDYYIDDLVINPLMDIGASKITINGYEVNLTPSINSYIINDTSVPSESIIDLTETDYYYDHSIVYESDKMIITLLNENLDEFEFEIIFNNSNILQGWHVMPTEYLPDVNNTAVGEIKDNEETIHIHDSSTTNSTYIYKQIEENTTALNFSFDFYLDSSVEYDQSLLKFFLSNGPMSNLNTFTTLGVKSFLTPQDGTTNEFLMLSKQVLDNNTPVESNLLDDTLITKDTWHNIEYYIDIVNNVYLVYLDGNIIVQNYDFYVEQNKLDYVYIGTDTEGTANYWLKNIEYIQVSGKPLTGITIDQVNLPEFDPDSDSYTYYTDTLLTNDTIITVQSNAFYGSTDSITKDIENQTVTIVILDNLGNRHTYTITYESLINRPISSSMLQDLVDSTLLLSEEDYTFNTWEVLESEVASSNAVLANPNSVASEFSVAYYELDLAISNLLVLSIYNEYDSSTVQTIRYSNNLANIVGGETTYAFKFEKVLDNSTFTDGVANKQVYKDINSIGFESVPYKYMNAEYLVLNNQIFNQGLMTFDPLTNVDVLVFKDRDAGPLTHPDYEYTGEIAVSTQGVVYKIYKHSFVRDSSGNDDININFDEIVNNTITSNNNIIAFIATSKSGNNVFVNENFNDYSAFSTYTMQSLFERNWENEVSNSYAENTMYENYDGLGNAININSTSNNTVASTYGWGIVYKEIAKLYEEIEYSFSFKTIDALSANEKHNMFTRVWLRDAPGVYNDTTDTDKVHALAEVYIHKLDTSPYKPTIMYQGSTKTSKPTMGTFTSNTWMRATVKVNLKTNKFTVSYGPEGGTMTTYGPYSRKNYWSVKVNNVTTTGDNLGAVVANYIYIASRNTSSTDMYFRDITVKPVNSNFYSDINVNSNSIGTDLFQDLTKDYLYQTNSKSVYSNPTVTVTEGSLFTNNSAVSNPTIITSTEGTNKYTTISETLDAGTSIGTYSRDYKIYHEVNSDDTVVSGKYAKNDLVDLLNICQKEKPVYYTFDSYSAFLIEINDAINRLSNHSSEVDMDYTMPNNSSDCTSAHGSWNSTSNTCSFTEEMCNSIGGMWNGESITKCSLDVTDDYLDLQTSKNRLVSINDTSLTYQGKIKKNKEYGEVITEDVYITNRSSLTGNFKVESRMSNGYIYSLNNHKRYLVVDSTLPENTKITMIEKTNGINNYFYYVVTANDASSKTLFALSAFTNNDLENTKYVNTYNFDSDTNVLSEEYQFIIDYEDTTGMSAGLHTLSMKLDVTINDIDTEISTSSVLRYTIYNNTHNIDLITSVGSEYYYRNQSIMINMNTTIENINIGETDITNTTFTNKKLGVILSLYDSENNLLVFPTGTTVFDGTNTYPLSSDGKLYINAGESITSFSKNVTISFGITKIQTGSYLLKSEIIESFDGFNTHRVIATDIDELLIYDNPNCNISAEVTGNTNVVHRTGNRELDFSIRTICNNAVGDQTITVSLYKKDNTLFNDFNYSLVDYQSFVNNSITVPYGNQTYKILTRSNSGLQTTDNTDNYMVHLKSDIAGGVYKLQFDILTENATNSDTLTFIVK